MSSEENTEVYIPKDACVRTVPLQCLPPSIARKVGVRPLPCESERSPNSSPQTAMWICPVELRDKGASTCGSTRTQRFLTSGQFRMNVISSNLTASRILHRFLSSGGGSPQAEEPNTPAVSSRVSGYRRNAVILYNGQIFLSVRKKRTRSLQPDSQSSSSPVRTSQQFRGQTGLMAPVSSDSTEPSTEDHEHEASPQTTNDKNEKTHISKRNERGEGQAEDDVRIEERPMKTEAGSPIREECNRDSDGEVHYNDDLMENPEEDPDPGQQADGILDGDISSLAEGWNAAAGIVNDGKFWSGSETPVPKRHQNQESADGPQLTGMGVGSAQTSAPEPSLQKNRAEHLQPSLTLPDFEALEQEERIGRCRNLLRTLQTKLDTLNSIK